MPAKNSVLSGFLIGMLPPALAWLFFNVIYTNVVILNKPTMPYFIALGINLVIIRICNKKNTDDTGKGVMMATFLSMLLLFIFKIRLT